MRDPVSHANSIVRRIIESAAKQAQSNGALPAGPLPDFIVEMPSDTSHGDFAANIALVGAKTFKMSPRAVAEVIVSNIEPHAQFSGVTVAGPGFINFTLSDKYFSDAVAQIIEDKDKFGHTGYGKNEKVMVEFVSANPTGPMHLGNARGGALGDSIASILEAAGYSVTREFYLNDAGNQVEKFGKSLEARYLAIYKADVEFPEDGYHGGDITQRAQEFSEMHGDKFVDAAPDERISALVGFALPRNVEDMKKVLHNYRVDYDVWFYESSLHKDGTVKKVLDVLTERGAAYEHDGALWYKATEFGGDKDEVLVKSNGFYTYFAVDIAYHYNKFVTRGFDKVINVWGADHHGHVARMKGALDALGIGGQRLDVVLMQLVNLVRDGEPVRMSKRTGQAITLTDLLDEIPVDAARFFFAFREYSSHFDFDLGLAVKKEKDNPVYYVQYAHARICSILRELALKGIDPLAQTQFDFELLGTEHERALIRKLSLLPSEIVAAARENEPARITRYTVDIATAFHKFYQECRVMCDDKELCLARSALCVAVRRVIVNCLGLLKIDAPETM